MSLDGGLQALLRGLVPLGQHRTLALNIKDRCGRPSNHSLTVSSFPQKPEKLNNSGK